MEIPMLCARIIINNICMEVELFMSCINKLIVSMLDFISIQVIRFFVSLSVLRIYANFYLKKKTLAVNICFKISLNATKAVNTVSGDSHGPLITDIYAITVVTRALSQFKDFLFRYKYSQHWYKMVVIPSYINTANVAIIKIKMLS